MAQLVLGSKHGKPAKLVDSAIMSDAKVDERKASEAGFYGTPQKPAFTSERWIPFVVAGDSLTKEQALKALGTLIDSIDAAIKANGEIKVEDKEGKVLFEGNLRDVAPGIENGQSVASYVVRMVQRGYKLAHQAQINLALRDQMLTSAEKKGLLKPTAPRASARRAGNDNVV